MKKYQRGEAMTVILIILVLVLAGVLGYLAWQHFEKKDDPSKVETSQQGGQEKENPKNEVPNNDFVIKEWSVKILSESELPITYEVYPTATNGLEATRLAMNYGMSCINEDSPVEDKVPFGVGTIFRTNNPNIPYGGITMAENFGSDLTVKIGDTYYFFQPVQGDGNCQFSEEDSSALQSVRDEIRTKFTKLTSKQ